MMNTLSGIVFQNYMEKWLQDHYREILAVMTKTVNRKVQDYIKANRIEGKWIAHVRPTLVIVREDTKK